MNSIERLCELASLCHDAAFDEERGVIDTAAPEIASYLHSGLASAHIARIQQLVQHDACLQAVVELLPQNWGYMLSRGRNGKSLASAFGPNGDRETTMEGKSEALALLGALSLAIVETLDDGALPDLNS